MVCEEGVKRNVPFTLSMDEGRPPIPRQLKVAENGGSGAGKHYAAGIRVRGNLLSHRR